MIDWVLSVRTEDGHVSVYRCPLCEMWCLEEEPFVIEGGFICEICSKKIAIHVKSKAVCKTMRDAFSIGEGKAK
jgi:hypothetical protein